MPAQNHWRGAKSFAVAVVGIALVSLLADQRGPGIAVGALVDIVIDVDKSPLVCRLAPPISGLVRRIAPQAKTRTLWFDEEARQSRISQSESRESQWAEQNKMNRGNEKHSLVHTCVFAVAQTGDCCALLVHVRAGEGPPGVPCVRVCREL